MNVRLHEVAAGYGGKVEEKEGVLFFDSGCQQQQGRCTDSYYGWVDKALNYASFDERHVTSQKELDFSSRELQKPVFCNSTTVSDKMANVLPGNIASSFPIVTSHTDDNGRSRVFDTETTSRSTARVSFALGAGNCNVACNVTSALCNVAQASANNSEAMSFCRDDGQPVAAVSQIPETCPMIPKNCQLGPIDVEDLAMYFDSSTDKPSSTSGRASHFKRPRYGGSKDQSCQDRIVTPEGNLNTTYNLRPCDLASSDLRNLGYSDTRACQIEYNVLEFNNSRSRHDPSYHDDPRLYDSSRTCDLKFNYPRSCEFERREIRRDMVGDTLERNDPRPGSNWLCNNCPGLFEFCNEERWLQCPASDRCPLYDNNIYDTPVLPPCMYENLHTGGNDSWHYGYPEDEQFLDYL